MRKKEIISRLNDLNLDKSSFIIVGKTSLVFYGIVRDCEKIEIESKTNLDIEDFTVNVVDSFDEIIEKDGFLCLSLENCLKRLKCANNISDKSIIKKIELYLDSMDNYKYERNLRNNNITLIGGVDEVGRGPLVGPVVAACCILPEKFELDGLTDSKKLSEAKREYFFEEIKKQAISYGIGIVSEKRIDEVNIYQATKEAMIMAINNCSVKPEHVLTDAMKLDISIPVTPIIKGDLRSITISAASVLAKVTRDRMLFELDKKYPMYDFKNNVGYPTKKHLEAIEKYGIIEEHRRSYGPVKDYLAKIDIDKK